jgi:hypothetical protein
VFKPPLCSSRSNSQVAPQGFEQTFPR